MRDTILWYHDLVCMHLDQLETTQATGLHFDLCKAK